MKFKKAFAVILAVAMVITLMPTMAFAATTNSVSEPNIKVAADSQIPAVKLNLKITGNDALKAGGKFELTLNNAEWYVDATEATLQQYTVNGVFADNDVIQLGKAANFNQVEAFSNKGATATFTKNTAEITLPNGASGLQADQYVVLYLNLKSGKNTGDVTVDINGKNSGITSGTVKVAEVVDGATTASVMNSDDIAAVSTDGTFTGNTIEIEENSVNAVADDQNEEYQAIRLALPKDYEWVMDGTTASSITGDLLKAGAVFKAYDANSHLSTLKKGRATNVLYDVNDNGNILTLYFNVNAQDYIQSMKITPVFKVGRDAAEGDVTVDITNLNGDISEASGLVIANNVVEAVEVTTFDELTTVQSGLMNKNNSSDPYYVYVQLKENVKDALTAGKTVYFDFPEEIQVLAGVKYTDVSNPKKTSGYNSSIGLDVPTTTTEDASEFEWVVDATYVANTDKDTITFKVPVSVEAGFTGDIDVTVSGAKAGVDEQTVTVGTAVNPLTIEATTNEVKTGIQNQVVSAITLKETAKGMLQDRADNETVTLSINGYENAGIVLNKANIKAEVTEGDIEISAPTVNATAGTISFDVKSSSSKASTIVISGFTVSMNRVAAEGGYDLRVSGNAVVDNAAYDNKNFQGYSVAAEDYLNVITPADSDIIANKVDATFVVGESQYTNNGVTVAMDVASFIQNNRTYVPVRFLANALGVTDENIAWNEGARTVTLTGANTVVKLTVGSNVITTSTGTVTADVPVIVKDNRTYLPARFVANAFGADVAWDAATRTVTITR